MSSVGSDGSGTGVYVIWVLGAENGVTRHFTSRLGRVVELGGFRGRISPTVGHGGYMAVLILLVKPGRFYNSVGTVLSLLNF